MNTILNIRKYIRLLNDTLFKENPITLWELITWVWDHGFIQVEHDLRKWYDQEVGAIYDDGPLNDHIPDDEQLPPNVPQR